MKTRETKQNDLNALTASLAASKSAMVVSFKGVSVAKDQEFRNSIREAGAKYEVVKNTLARIAVKGTDFEQASDHFKGVTAIAWTENDPVVLTKAISKFMKDNADIYTFKTGVVDGSLVDLAKLTTIANLPSKDELIAKLLFVLNAQAQRIVTVISAVPRNLAVVVKQIGEQEGRAPGTPEPAAESAPAEAPAEETPAVEEATAEAAAPAAEEATPVEAPAEGTPAEEAAAETAPPAEDKAASAGPTAEASTSDVVAADDAAAEVVAEPV